MGRSGAVAIYRDKKVLSPAPVVGISYIVLVFVAVHAFPSGAGTFAGVTGALMVGYLLIRLLHLAVAPRRQRSLRSKDHLAKCATGKPFRLPRMVRAIR